VAAADLMNAGDTPLVGERREELRRRLQSLGFDEVRFAAAAPAGGESLRAWLAAGNHADMAWMERTLGKRSDVTQVLAGAATVIVLGVNYWPGDLGGPKTGDTPSRPRWARYALHEDYHDTLKPGLQAAGGVLKEMLGLGTTDYRYYTDTGPLLERGWAARAGLGFRGKNAMLISRRHGNWLLLGCIVVRKAIAPDEPLRSAGEPTADERAGLLCGKCTRCLDACPTDAFPRPGVVDARRCISYQTIENKSHIPREFRAAIGDRVYGCDACLEVCPWNRFAQIGRRVLLSARHDLADLGLADLLAMTPERFATVFRRTPIKRLKLSGLLRNAAIVAGNSGDASFLPVLAELARHETTIVRGAAVWAVRRLAGSAAVEWLSAARAVERDSAVLAEYVD
jgi:epoxyqueuosine reductase